MDNVHCASCVERFVQCGERSSVDLWEVCAEGLVRLACRVLHLKGRARAASATACGNAPAERAAAVARNTTPTSCDHRSFLSPVLTKLVGSHLPPHRAPSLLAHHLPATSPYVMPPATATKKPSVVYAPLVNAAILALKERSGSSLAAIKKWIAANHPEATNETAIKTALKSGVTKGTLVRVKASYKISELGKKAMKPAKKKAKPKKKV
eukprot:scaffold224030_cov28-Tisochrysis_lutea.AAC.1